VLVRIMDRRIFIIEQQIRALDGILRDKTPTIGTINKVSLDLWQQRTASLLRTHVGPDRADAFEAAARTANRASVSTFREQAVALRHFLEGLLEDERTLHSHIPVPSVLPSPPSFSNFAAVQTVEWICRAFHPFAVQLGQRQRGKAPWIMEDEYDVQDAIHALLRMHFRDVRAEEWTPSYAGAASRVDFLLKPERLVVELKRSRRTLTAKQLGEQLIIDIERYRAHPNCDHLVCFTYDPEQHIANAAGVAADLSRRREDLDVHVLILPR
jgi:hypothetical protein